MTDQDPQTDGMQPATAHRTLAVGEMLNWYRIEAVLGRGGFGVIYRATDTNLDHPVAIKEYIPSGFAERDGDTAVRPLSLEHADQYRWGLERFIKEARNLVRFKHPNIVRVMSVFQQNNTAYMVMEFEAGEELGRYLTRPGATRESRLKTLIAPVCEGLLEVHRHGFIHRDIKPANILVRPDGSPVLLDFGSARDASLGQGRGLTALVSAGYAPLEQYDQDEHEQQGPWTDVYALGGVLYHAISGNEPTDSARRGSALLNGGRDPLIAAATIGRGRYGARFLAAIDWALEFRIADRPQSVRDWLPALLGHTEHAAPTRAARPARNGGAAGAAGTAATPAGDPVDPADHSADTAADEFWPMTKASQPMSRRVSGPSMTGSASMTASARAGGRTAAGTSGARSATDRAGHTRRGSRTSGPATRRETARRSLVPSTLRRSVHAVRRAIVPILLGVALASAAIFMLIGRDTPSEVSRRAVTASAGSDEVDPRIERFADLERREQAFEERQEQARVQAERARATRAARLEAERLDRERAAREAERRRTQQLRAQETKRERALAESSRQFTVALDKAEKAIEERRVAAARQALDEAQATGFVGRRLGVVSDRLEALLAEMRRPVSDAEFDAVVKRFDQLKRAIEGKAANTIDELTESSPENALFGQLNERFEALNMEITGIRVRNADKSVSATLRIRDMVRANGDRAVPSPAFREREITSRLVDGGWSRIRW